MEEQLISFETAKLAKDKGFDAKTNLVYATTGVSEEYNECRFKLYGDYFFAPTQSLLQKWLREKHNIYVIVTEEFYTDGINHNVQVLAYDANNIKNDCINNDKSTGMYGDNGEFETYEDALEFGLVKALKFIN